MARYDIALSDELSDWIESRVTEGRYASVAAYLDSLVRRDVSENDDDAAARLRAALEMGRRSGISTRSLNDILRDHMSARNAA